MDFVNCPEYIPHVGKYTMEDIFIRFAFTVFLLHIFLFITLGWME